MELVVVRWNRRGLLRPFISFYLPLILPESLGSSRSHQRERETRDDGWCEEGGCSEGACKNSRTYLRASLSALLRRQSKLTKATEADAANARIVCQKPGEFAWEAKWTPQIYFQLCVAKPILPHAETKADAGRMQQRTPLDRNLMVRVYAPAQAMRARKTRSKKKAKPRIEWSQFRPLELVGFHSSQLS